MNRAGTISDRASRRMSQPCVRPPRRFGRRPSRYPLTVPICTCTQRIPTELAPLARWWSLRLGLAWRPWQSPTTTRSPPCAVARPEAARWGVELIAGVELTCENEDREIHILGHFIRDDDPALLRGMASLRAGRVQRIEAMAARLAAWALDRSRRRPSRLPPRHPGAAPHGRLSGANPPGRQHCARLSLVSSATDARPASINPGSTAAWQSP